MAISTGGSKENAPAATGISIDGSSDVPAPPDSNVGQNAGIGVEESGDGLDEFADAASGSTENTVEARHEGQTGDRDTTKGENDAPVVAEAAENEDGIVPSLQEDQNGRSLGGVTDAEVQELEDMLRMEFDRAEEATALPGAEEITDNEGRDVVPDQDTMHEDAALLAGGDGEDEDAQAASGNGSFQDLPDNQPMSAPVAETVITGDKRHTGKDEYGIILESLQDSLTRTQYISSKIDAVSGDTDCLIKQVNNLSMKYELLASEMETNSSDTSVKSILSKTFLTIASLAVALLVIAQIYMFTSLIKIQRLQNAAGSSVLANITGLNKKMADYDKNLTKALDNTAKQEHSQPGPAVTEKSGHGSPLLTGAGSATVTPVNERLNKLRNGLPEKRLIRKETGDWFVYNNKKSEECISDSGIIDLLNQAYRKIGRPLSPTIPIPSHNALCILKPDGKGGTEIVMTKDFLP